MNEIGELIRSYLEIILNERVWSWSLIGILYLVIGMMIRGWFMNPMIRKGKDLDSKHFQEIKKGYLKGSMWGWIFFFVPLVIIIALWNQSVTLPLEGRELWILLLAVLSFLLSIMLHMLAFGVAGMHAVKLIENEMGVNEIIKNK